VLFPRRGGRGWKLEGSVTTRTSWHARHKADRTTRELGASSVTSARERFSQTRLVGNGSSYVSRFALLVRSLDASDSISARNKRIGSSGNLDRDRNRDPEERCARCSRTLQLTEVTLLLSNVSRVVASGFRMTDVNRTPSSGYLSRTFWAYELISCFFSKARGFFVKECKNRMMRDALLFDPADAAVHIFKVTNILRLRG